MKELWKKASHISLLLLSLFIMLSLVPHLVTADEGVVLSEYSDKVEIDSQEKMKYFEFDKTTLDDSQIPLSGIGPDELVVGKTYTAFYPDALTYFNDRTLSVKLDVTYLGTNDYYSSVINQAIQDGEELGIRSCDDSEIYDWRDYSVKLGAFGFDFKVKISFYEDDTFDDSKLTNIDGAISFRDPDQANYIYNTAGRTIYYLDANNIIGKNPDDTYIHGDLELSNYYKVFSSGIKHINTDDTAYVSWPNFDDGIFEVLISEEEDPFEFEVNGKQDILYLLPDILIVKVPYIVQYFYEENGQYPTTPDSTSAVRKADIYKTPTVSATEAEGDFTVNPPDTKTGRYELDESRQNEWLNVALKEDGTTVLNVYFKEKFTVTYKPGDHGTFNETTTEGIDYGKDTPTAPETTGELGWVFTNWDIEIEDTVTHDAVYVAQWAHDPNTAYTVEYYYQEAGEYPELPQDTDNRIGTAFETASLLPEDYNPNSEHEGYVVDENPKGKVYSKEIAPDGSTVLRIYFKPQFTVVYKPGDHGAFPETTHSGIDYGDNTPAPPATNGQPGYAFDGWDIVIEDTVTHDAVYVAKWRKLPSYTLPVTGIQ